jgi:hypothetical protein
MNIKTVLKTIAAGLIASCAAAPIHAGQITFTFSGTITSANVDNVYPEPSPFPQPTDLGSAFSGTYSFDPSAPNAISGYPSSGSYDSPDGLFSLNLGGLSFSFLSINIGVVHTDPVDGGDFYTVLHYEDPTADNPTGVDLYFLLNDPTGGSLVDNSQPLTPPPLAGFDTTNAFLFTDTVDGVQVEFGGSLDKLTEVPEPRWPIVVVLGAALATAWRRQGMTRNAARED